MLFETRELAERRALPFSFPRWDDLGRSSAPLASFCNRSFQRSKGTSNPDAAETSGHQADLSLRRSCGIYGGIVFSFERYHRRNPCIVVSAVLAKFVWIAFIRITDPSGHAF